MPHSEHILRELLSPVTPEDFFSAHWERAPLVVARREPAHYANLLSESDVDFVVSTVFARERGAVELLGGNGDGNSRNVRVPQNVAEIYEGYRLGATIRAYKVHAIWKPLRTLCARLEQFFGFPAKANLYCSPPSAQGTKRHYDTHDVLVLQLHGRKHWRVYEPVVRLPLATVPPLPFEERDESLKYARGGPKKGRGDVGEAESGAPTHEVVLEPGDLLYLPRGFVHEAWTSESASTHVTVGLHVTTWLDVLTVALAQLSNRDERFRSVPASLFNPQAAQENDAVGEMFATLLRAFAGGAKLEGALAEINASFVHSRQATGDGLLIETESPSAQIESHTLLEKRGGLVCRVVVNGEMAGLVAAHKIFWMPKSFAPALRFVAETERFCAEEFPGQMSEHSKAVLARRMADDGFLRVASEF